MELVSEILYPQYLRSREVSTDSRHITSGSIFFALRGDHFDGNRFAADALRQGAALCVVDDPAAVVDRRCVLVPDVLQTLQALARHHREQLAIPVIAVTGTNGKTTTKELLHAVLQRRFRTHATRGNLNNHIGVPLTLLQMPPETEIAVIEMGASHPGEIDELCSVAQPNYGLITNVGKAHLEGFGSLQGVVRTKTELYRFLATVGGTLFVNADNALLMEQAAALSSLFERPSPLPGIIPNGPADLADWRPARGQVLGLPSMVPYGRAAEADSKGRPVSCDPYMKFCVEENDRVYSVQSQLLGRYNFDNAMAAVCVGRHFHVEMFDIKEAIEQYQPHNRRSELTRTTRNELILDCYNANPSSVAAALDSFDALPHDRKVVMMGSMKELGSTSDKEHRDVVKRLERGHFERIVLVGDEYRFASQQGHLWFATADEARQHFEAHPIEGCLVLLKGSNATRMWEIADAL